MFTYKKWDSFCCRLVSMPLSVITAAEIVNYRKSGKKCIVLKHDVETSVKKALKIAQIEMKYGVKATYYVQSYLLKDNSSLLKKIAEMGHEVTYHYDVLDSNNGDMNAAINEFQSTLDAFSDNGLDVRTVCPHGNPVMMRQGWNSNKDFFRSTEVSRKYPDILDVVVDLPRLLQGNMLYISDSGFCWKHISNIDSNDISNSGDIKLSGYDALFELIEKSECIIVSSHPHRWEATELKVAINKVTFVLLRFVARKLSEIKFFKKVMSKFYYLAKKI